MFAHFLLPFDGTVGSNGSHSPRFVAVLAYLMTHNFGITPCAASMENRPPDLRLVRVVHSFTGRVVLEATHPRLWQVRVFLLRQWTWDAVRRSLPDGYCKFNVELFHNNRPLNAFRALMSLTDEDTLEIGYVIKELRVPGPRTRRAMTEAIARHQSDLVYSYLSRYKVPDVVRVVRGETISPVSLLLWAPYLVVEDVTRIPRALESLLSARCSPNLLGSPARAPLSIAVAFNDLESVEELLAHRANPNIASEGEEPPICAAVRHRRRDIVGALLEHRADSNVRSLPTTPTPAMGHTDQGLTPLELADGDERLIGLLTDFCSTLEDVRTSAYDI